MNEILLFFAVLAIMVGGLAAFAFALYRSFGPATQHLKDIAEAEKERKRKVADTQAELKRRNERYAKLMLSINHDMDELNDRLRRGISISLNFLQELIAKTNEAGELAYPGEAQDSLATFSVKLKQLYEKKLEQFRKTQPLPTVQAGPIDEKLPPISQPPGTGIIRK